MARYLISIKDTQNNSERLVSCEDFTDFSDTLTKGKIVMICDNAFHAGGTVPRPESTNLRQTVLSEEWEPKDREPFGLVRPDNGTDFGFDATATTVLIWKKRGYVFVPKEHPELAAEIVSIRKGEWLPKKGDRFYCSDHGDIYEIAAFDFAKSDTCHYFPSTKQRDTFISQHKKEEPEPIPRLGARSGFYGMSLKEIYELMLPFLKRGSEGYTNEEDKKYKVGEEFNIPYSKIGCVFGSRSITIIVAEDGFLKLKP